MAKKKKDELQEKLVYKPKLIWNAVDSKGKKEIFGFSEKYKKFVGEVKTEREFVKKARERTSRFLWTRKERSIRGGCGKRPRRFPTARPEPMNGLRIKPEEARGQQGMRSTGTRFR